MNVVIALEHRFLGTPDGAVWTDGTYPRAFWDRYLAAFDAVTILARVRPVERAASQWGRVDDAAVRVHAVPDYQGPLQYLQRRSHIRRAIGTAVGLDAAFILRVPGQMGMLAASMLTQRGRPFSLEVVGDPWDGFAPGASRHPLRAFFRWRFSTVLRHQCLRAPNILYVTQEFLQRRYPPGNATGTSMGISDVELSEAAFTGAGYQARRSATDVTSRPIRLASIGAMNQPYKGFTDLLQAAALCRAAALPVELTLIGDGAFKSQYEQEAASLGIRKHVRFAGQLPAGQPVREELDRADIYVQPSLVEGLPRALVEAMARGCPCIATAVGGIPELLPTDVLVAPQRPAQLAAAIQALAADVTRLQEASKRNIAVARTFSEKALAPKRLAFYRAVTASHQSWLKTQTSLG